MIWDWTQVYQTIGEHSTLWDNKLPIIIFDFDIPDYTIQLHFNKVMSSVFLILKALFMGNTMHQN